MIALITAAALTLAADAVPEAARHTIAQANAAWLEAMKHQDAAAIAAVYGDEAIFVTPTGESLRGRAAIEAFERARFAQTGRVVDGRIEDDGLTTAGRLVYEWGHATLQIERPDDRATVTGRFLTVWSPDASGRWRIIRNLSLPE
ncbi:MAG TPA: SgcJ/EcaC family oxidoreductase [Vicinamibacterales bacterium]|nr:SgcJ/EcaC family oxidoreductase [Vicinamibacterales bacterium]